MSRILLALVLAACHPTPETGSPPDGADVFPEGFLWGTSTAGFQVEPGCPSLAAEVCEDPASDWYQWVTDPDLLAEEGLALSGEPVSAGPGMFELLEEDLARAAGELGTGAIRVSIEWSRLFPDRAAEQATSVEALSALVDPDGLAWTHRMLGAIREAGLVPLVTLNHYTLPRWLHDGKDCHLNWPDCADRGWVDGPRILPLVERYAAFCAREFGGEVDLWVTLNEPLVTVLSSYVQPNEDRTGPPAVVDYEAGLEAAFNQARAHARMYAAVHAEDGVDADGDGVAARVGLADHLVHAVPYDEDDEDDVRGAVHLDRVYNRLFLDAAILGQLDTDLDGTPDEEIPGAGMDFLGVNYYNQVVVLGAAEPLVAGMDLLDFLPVEFRTDRPEGMAVVLGIGRDYGLPVIVTENGKGNPGDDAADTFLEPMLAGVLQAISEGAEVEGYFYWSLLDNYEWNHGMDAIRFGLYAVDPETKGRTLRSIGARFRAIASSGTLGETE